jgi:hypothetical protein
MSAVKRDGDRALAQEIIEADEPSLLVGQVKRRHRVAGLRRRRPGPARLKADDEPVHGVGKRRAQPRDQLGESLKPFVQGRVHVAALRERVFEGLAERF